MARKHRHEDNVQKSRHDNGRFCAHAVISCAKCKKDFLIPIDDCPSCGDAIATINLNHEVECPRCHALYAIDTELPVHCAHPYSESCVEEVAS